MVNIFNPDNSSQEVPLSAAAYNIKGIVALELSKVEEAKTNFNKGA